MHVGLKIDMMMMTAKLLQEKLMVRTNATGLIADPYRDPK